MKWKSHREVTRALAEDLGLDISQRERMVEGSVYPDKVGMGKAKGKSSIFGVPLTYPHHKETNERIRQILLRMRSSILDGQKIDPFDIGCLAHLIQDRAVFPYSHSNFEQFELEIAKYRVKNEWRNPTAVPTVDGRILNALPNILTIDNPNDPEAALKEGYDESLLILKSLLQPPNLPSDLQPIYERTKKSISSKIILRYAYWFLTYLNPLAPVNAYLDRKAIANQNIVKRYGFAKEGAIWKGTLSILACLIAWGAWWGFWCLLPLIGQILTAWIKIPIELMRNLEWFNFEK